MDSFELNKIMGAILGTLLFVMGVGFLAEAIYHPIEDRGPGYYLPEPEAGAVAEVEAAPVVPLPVLLASANAEQGASAARKCTSCHNFEQGAGNKQGPELWGVVGRVIGSHEGFAYSDVLLEHQAAGDVWSYENLDHFLLAPKDFAPGTKMNFAGVKNDEERANILAYLQTLSDNPVPFPEPAPAAEEPAADDAVVTDEIPAADVETTDTPAGTEALQLDDIAIDTPTVANEDSPVVGTPVVSTETSDDSATPATTETDAAPAETDAAPAGSDAAPAADAPASSDADTTSAEEPAPTSP
ncbi:c-type cytochrome [Devosia sp.]|uniref:c-type cytochrome n=1 Tax=Devosia sp. TaxID=1871048 RepID=UPI003A8F802E